MIKNVFFVVALLLSHGLLAEEVQIKLLALFESKAMVSVNGKPKTLKKGDTFSGVKLVDVDTSQAIVEVNEEEQVLQLGVGILTTSLAAAPTPSNKKSIILWADDNGFFYANGSIGKNSSRFLIDTGANVVALSSTSADSLGLDYKDAPKSVVATASGHAPAYDIVIKKLNIEGLVLYDVDASIIVGQHPSVPLLGMSFLGKLDMKREGDRMKLEKRF